MSRGRPWFHYRVKAGRMKAMPVTAAGWATSLAAMLVPLVATYALVEFAPREIWVWGLWFALFGLNLVALFWLVKAKGERLD